MLYIVSSTVCCIARYAWTRFWKLQLTWTWPVFQDRIPIWETLQWFNGQSHGHLKAEAQLVSRLVKNISCFQNSEFLTWTCPGLYITSATAAVLAQLIENMQEPLWKWTTEIATIAAIGVEATIAAIGVEAAGGIQRTQGIARLFTTASKSCKNVSRIHYILHMRGVIVFYIASMYGHACIANTVCRLLLYHVQYTVCIYFFSMKFL